MVQRILVMGLPGAGKTYLTKCIVDQFLILNAPITWINADIVRKKYNDWDFSPAGRIRQSIRMKALADTAITDYVICDFIAPLEEQRENFEAHWTIWVDTIKESRFDDTNKMFTPPKKYDFRVTEKFGEGWSQYISNQILNQAQQEFKFSFNDLVA
jgi:adenylylsulfate kinase